MFMISSFCMSKSIVSGAIICSSRLERPANTPLSRILPIDSNSSSGTSWAKVTCMNSASGIPLNRCCKSVGCSAGKLHCTKVGLVQPQWLNPVADNLGLVGCFRFSAMFPSLALLLWLVQYGTELIILFRQHLITNYFLVMFISCICKSLHTNGDDLCVPS